MKKAILLIGITLLIIATFISCSPKTQVNDSQKIEEKEKSSGTVVQPSPPVIIYKTKEDYSDKVPVTLSDDKSKIISYPDARDLIRNGKLTLPVELHDGFLLDKRGIDQNVAFLAISYGTFTRAMRVYTVDQLFEMILDNDPLTEMYDCGGKNDFKDLVNELNSKIDNGELDSFKRMK
jgi:hypothetical protein